MEEEPGAIDALQAQMLAMQNELAFLKANPVSAHAGPLIFGPGEIAEDDEGSEEGSDTSRPRTPDPAADTERVVPLSVV